MDKMKNCARLVAILTMASIGFSICPPNFARSCSSRDLLVSRMGTTARTSMPSAAAETMLVDGRKRTFHVYVPPSLQGKLVGAPLVIVCHGGGGTGLGSERNLGMDAMSAQFGFVVVYPDGIERHWHDGRPKANPEVDDVHFISVLIDKLVSQYQLDPKRVFACGISNGGIFSNYLALHLANKIRAVASIAGDIATPEENSLPSNPVSIMLIHGTDDSFVPINGGPLGHPELSKAAGGSVLSHSDTVNRWIRYDGGAVSHEFAGIPAGSYSMVGRRVSRVATPASITNYITRSGARVSDVIVEHGGHTWPGHPIQLFGLDGVTAMNFDASKLISEFFLTVGRDGAGSLR